MNDYLAALHAVGINLKSTDPLYKEIARIIESIINGEQ